MPLYSFKDTNTGELIDKQLKLAEYDDFKKDNPHLERYHGEPPKLVTHTGNIVSKTPDSWKSHLKSISKASGDRVKTNIKV